MVGINAQLSIQWLLVLNPDRSNAAVVGASYICRQAVADVDGLMRFALCELEGFFENRARRFLLRLLPANDNVIDMLGELYRLDLGNLRELRPVGNYNQGK